MCGVAVEASEISHASRLTRREGESDDEFRARKAATLADVERRSIVLVHGVLQVRCSGCRLAHQPLR